jgi:NitT/TauT family transport system substrate-binding protein
MGVDDDGLAAPDSPRRSEGGFAGSRHVTARAFDHGQTRGGGMFTQRLRIVGLAASTLVIATTATLGSVALAQDQTLPPIVAPSEPPGVTYVPVQLDFVLSGAYGALLWGKDKGYFRDRGIDLDLIAGQGTDLAMQQINTGAVDFAIVDVGNYIEQRIAGQTDTNAVYVQFPIGTTGILSLGTPINTPQDMAGKVFCTVPQSSGRTKIPLILHQNGVEWDETQLLNLMEFSVLYTTLFQGPEAGCDTAETGLAGSWEGVSARAIAQGLTPYYKPISDWGYKDYSKMLIVSKDALENRPELVQAFVDAYWQSQVDAYANATGDDVYNLLVKLDPQADQAITNAVWDSVVTYGKGFGRADPSVIQYQMDLLKSADPPITTDMTPEEFFTNEYIDKAIAAMPPPSEAPAASGG